MQAHGFTTLFVLFKWDLQAAMKDYPEDQALLSRLQKFFGKNSKYLYFYLANIIKFTNSLSVLDYNHLNDLDAQTDKVEPRAVYCLLN